MNIYSIIIPVFNAEKTLRRAIDSVINQTYINWELILVNDGSIDNSKEIIENYSKRDQRIKAINQKNVGPGLSRNAGIEIAKGDYITFLDADDYYDNDYLECIEKITNNSQMDVVFVDFYDEDSTGKILGNSSIYSYRDLSIKDFLCLQMTGLISWGPVVKAVHKDIIKSCKFNDLEVGEEAIYSFDVVNKAKKIGFVEKPKYHYIRNINGQHKKGGLDPWWSVVETMKKHLIELGCYSDFETNINSFALRALCINIYRCACTSRWKTAVENIKKAYHKYSDNYELNKVYKKSIDNKSMVVFFCLKLHLYWLVYCASRLRNRKL